MFEEKGSFPRRAVHDRFDDLIFHEYVVVPIYVTICQSLLRNPTIAVDVPQKYRPSAIKDSGHQIRVIAGRM